MKSVIGVVSLILVLVPAILTAQMLLLVVKLIDRVSKGRSAVAPPMRI